MSVTQTNESLLKNTVKCQQVEINVLRKEYEALKEKYNALVNASSSNEQAPGSSTVTPDPGP